MRTMSLVFGLMSALTASMAARAEMSTDEARALAEAFAGADLTGADPVLEETGGERWATFVASAPRARYKVNLTRGFLGYYSADDVQTGTPDDHATAEATLLVRRTAERVLGDRVRDLTWSASASAEGLVTVSGSPGSPRDVPRAGAGIEVHAMADAEGSLVFYSQHLPAASDSSAAPVAVSEEQAGQIALTDLAAYATDRGLLDWGDLRVRSASLGQGGGRAVWSVELSDYDPGAPTRAPKAIAYVIDAQSGAVLERGLAATGAWRRAAGPDGREHGGEGANRSLSPAVVLIAGAILAGGVATHRAIRRRR